MDSGSGAVVGFGGRCSGGCSAAGACPLFKAAPALARRAAASLPLVPPASANAALKMAYLDRARRRAESGAACPCAQRAGQPCCKDRTGTCPRGMGGGAGNGNGGLATRANGLGTSMPQTGGSTCPCPCAGGGGGGGGGPDATVVPQLPAVVGGPIVQPAPGGGGPGGPPPGLRPIPVGIGPVVGPPPGVATGRVANLGVPFPILGDVTLGANATFESDAVEVIVGKTVQAGVIVMASSGTFQIVVELRGSNEKGNWTGLTTDVVSSIGYTALTQISDFGYSFLSIKLIQQTGSTVVLGGGTCVVSDDARSAVVQVPDVPRPVLQPFRVLEGFPQVWFAPPVSRVFPPPPERTDCACWVRIIALKSEREVATLKRQIGRALPPHGTIQDIVSGTVDTVINEAIRKRKVHEQGMRDAHRKFMIENNKEAFGEKRAAEIADERLSHGMQPGDVKLGPVEERVCVAFIVLCPALCSLTAMQYIESSKEEYEKPPANEEPIKVGQGESTEYWISDNAVSVRRNQTETVMGDFRVLAWADCPTKHPRSWMIIAEAHREGCTPARGELRVEMKGGALVEKGPPKYEDSKPLPKREPGPKRDRGH